MRRENSKFNAAFVSYEGSELFNNDYYGSAELERFACYVAADGLEPGEIESGSARVAVQAAIAAFHEHPSITRRALKRYVRAAHEALRENTEHLSLRASIMVAATNYQKARYAWAGNTRFYLYRAGRLIRESTDHSLARQMAGRGELPMDKIALHEERNNLARYVGQPEALVPQVARKIKFHDGDIFTLITRGAWERCDAGDVKATLDSAENDPKLALDGLERLMLDPYPDELDNYTAAAVFVDKVFTDPNRKKKIRLVVTISLIAAALITALIVLLVVMHNNREAKRRDMNVAFLSAVEYIGDNNYPRAAENLDTAISLAKELKDRTIEDNADRYQKLVDAIINGDDLFAAGDYEGAQDAYLTARDRTRFTDNYGQAYIQRKLALVANFLSVRDLIALGDVLTSNGSYSLAEGKYLDAQRLAAGINDAGGRQEATDALQNLYDLREREQAASQEAAAEQAKTLQEAADMEDAGDKAAAEKDLVSAKLYYDIARERYIALDDSASSARVDGKLSSLADTKAQSDEQSATAAKLVEDGDTDYDSGYYVEAKVKFIQARNIYSRLQDEAALAGVLARIDMCDSMIGRNAAEESQGAALEALSLQEAADMEAAGDRAAAGKELASARLYYDIARARFIALEDSASVARIDGKLSLLASTQAQNDAQASAAAKLVADGDADYDAGYYADAKVKYIQARNIYTQMQDDTALAGIMIRIDMCDSMISRASAEKPQETTQQNQSSPKPTTPPDIAPGGTVVGNSATTGDGGSTG